VVGECKGNRRKTRRMRLEMLVKMDFENGHCFVLYFLSCRWRDEGIGRWSKMMIV